MASFGDKHLLIVFYSTLIRIKYSKKYAKVKQWEKG